MGRGQATILLDGCVYLVGLFNRASITLFYYGYGWVSFLSCIDTADILVVDSLYLSRAFHLDAVIE